VTAQAGLLTRGSRRFSAFPGFPQWHREEALAAHSCGGSSGVGSRVLLTQNRKPHRIPSWPAPTGGRHTYTGDE